MLEPIGLKPGAARSPAAETSSSRPSQLALKGTVDDSGGKIRSSNPWAGVHGDHLLHGMLELADIAGPIVLHQRVHNLVCHAMAVAIALQEMRDEGRNIIFPLTQGGKPQPHNIQPVIKILSKPLCFHFSNEIAIGCGDNAEIGASVRKAAYRSKLFLLQHPEQFHLQLVRKLANLIEECGAPVGCVQQVRVSGYAHR